MSSGAAIWSAVAASLAAITAALTWWTHHRTLQESVRPELVLKDWVRVADGGSDAGDQVVARSIRNVGRGPAFDVSCLTMRTGWGVDDATEPQLTLRIPVLSPGEDAIIDHVAAQTTCERGGAATITLSCLDHLGRERETTYDLVIGGANSFNDSSLCMLAPGVVCEKRRTSTRPRWLRKSAQGVIWLPRHLRYFHYGVRMREIMRRSGPAS